MSQDSQPLSEKDKWKKIQSRMLSRALFHFNNIGPRSIRALEELDLFDEKVPPIGGDIDLTALQDPEHFKNNTLNVGPLFFYVTNGEKPHPTVVEFSTLLLSEIQKVRTSTLSYLERLIEAETFKLTPKTSAIFKANRDNLSSEDPVKWRPAGIAFFDALNDDILVSIQGIRQCLSCEPVNQELLNVYVKKVLHPPVTSLDSIDLGLVNVKDASKSFSSVLTLINRKARNLSELCSLYQKEIGFLPFAPKYSLGKAVNRWLRLRQKEPIWDEIWNWAHNAHGPLPEYHACSIFVLYPIYIPENRMPDLWGKILNAVHRLGKSEPDGQENNTSVAHSNLAEEKNSPDRNDSDFDNHEDWALRQDLARHYSYHLEACLPDNCGEKIGVLSWWLAEQVASIFPDDLSSAKFYRKHWIKPALERSSQIWLTANAPIQPTFLRYISFTAISPWSASMLCLMGKNMRFLAPRDQSEEIQNKFHDALFTNALYGMPFPITSPKNPTYALECSMAQTIIRWSRHLPIEQKRMFKQIAVLGQSHSTPEGLCAALQELHHSLLHEQVFVALSLKAKALTDIKFAESIWEVVSNKSWREDVLATVSPQIQGLLIDALSYFQIANQGKWFSQWPHYLAELCEKSVDKERQQALFYYALHASLASDTVSAIHRLLRGDQKEKYLEYAKFFRDRLEVLRPHYPPWVVGKVRGLIANLHVV